MKTAEKTQIDNERPQDTGNDLESGIAASTFIRHPELLNELTPEIRDWVWTLVHFRADEAERELERDKHAIDVDFVCGALVDENDTLKADNISLRAQVAANAHVIDELRAGRDVYVVPSSEVA